MGLGIPPLEVKILLGSNPLKSRILVRRLAVESVSRGLFRMGPVRSGMAEFQELLPFQRDTTHTQEVDTCLDRLVGNCFLTTQVPFLFGYHVGVALCHEGFALGSARQGLPT